MRRQRAKGLNDADRSQGCLGVGAGTELRTGARCRNDKVCARQCSTPADAVRTPLTAVTRRAMRGLLLPPPRHMKRLAQAVTNTPPCRATVQVVTKQGSEWVWFCRPLGETHILKEASRIAHC